MTTSNETIQQRSVSQLMQILETENTFQGMSDAEIRSVIEYEKQMAALNARTEQLASDSAQYRAAMQARTETSLQNQEAMLQSILESASNMQLKVVQYG